MFSMTFNGVTKPYITVLEVIRPSWASIKRNILTIPGRPGGYLQDTETGPRLIGARVLIKNEDYFEDLQKLKEDMAEWLITEKEEELVFGNEPDRSYYAAVDGALDLKEMVSAGQGTIYFICPDPYKYGPEKTLSFTDATTIHVEGTVETHPIVKVEVKQDTTFVAVSDGQHLNLIGNPIEVTQQPFVREERKLWNEMGSLVGWSDTAVVEEGVITGTMKTTGYSFFTEDYGANAGWHGPAKKISIGSTIQDFQVDALILQKGVSGQVGSVEIALLDVNNQFVGKMLMTKRSANSKANWARLRAGTTANGFNLIDYSGVADWVWENFEGMLRIGRIGNRWYAYVTKIDQYGQHSGFYKEWSDTAGIATAPIAQIQVQVWQYGTIPATSQNIVDLKAYQINSPGDNQIPYIARAGDVIEFDHQQDIIRRNGEDITKAKAFIGEYFPLKKGANAIVVEPAEAILSTEVRWKPKWR